MLRMDKSLESEQDNSQGSTVLDSQEKRPITGGWDSILLSLACSSRSLWNEQRYPIWSMSMSMVLLEERSIMSHGRKDLMHLQLCSLRSVHKFVSDSRVCLSDFMRHEEVSWRSLLIPLSSLTLFSSYSLITSARLLVWFKSVNSLSVDSIDILSCSSD